MLPLSLSSPCRPQPTDAPSSVVMPHASPSARAPRTDLGARRTHPGAPPAHRGRHLGCPGAWGAMDTVRLATSAGGEDHEATQGWRARHVPAPGDVRVDGHRVTSLQ